MCYAWDDDVLDIFFMFMTMVSPCTRLEWVGIPLLAMKLFITELCLISTCEWLWLCYFMPYVNFHILWLFDVAKGGEKRGLEA